MYAMGLLGDGERKSVEPIALGLAEIRTVPRHTLHELLNFVTESQWQDQPVREAAARYGVEAMTSREPIEAWIVDDTAGFPKARQPVAWRATAIQWHPGKDGQLPKWLPV